MLPPVSDASADDGADRLRRIGKTPFPALAREIWSGRRAGQKTILSALAEATAPACSLQGGEGWPRTGGVFAVRRLSPDSTSGLAWVAQ